MGFKTQQGASPSPSYKKYVANLNQSGTSAPVATVYENTIGIISTAYLGVGDFKITSTGNFTVGKTWIIIAQANGFAQSLVTAGVFGDGNNIEVQSLDSDVGANDILSDCSIEIRVYR